MPRISDLIQQDHRDLVSFYNHIINSSDQDEKVRYQNRFTWELARHSISEELVLYPAFEKHVENGVAVADRDRREHQRVKEQLEAFYNMAPSSPSFLPTIKGLMKDFSRHIEEETTDVWKLEDALSEEDSKGLAESFGKTKVFVPPQWHREGPYKPPFESAIELLAAPVEHLADWLHQWPYMFTAQDHSAT
ncbi:hypothetical protein ASPWEDRAFT_108292 [Aspergillus wentii DTO 134E9]|uniref:Hemerythrin-like domain-containing protein n=1 Tax=Aspergillus wentii DTO 134E9 TaxID=1073089 RepID=A0A1L9RS31_ASPWE|nr:uncharacterized protein ASPWEDRAFT_108292 [Aspergillus wentii DTO 134E9]KAI9930557.1 hypothetical protein MW887_011311 [Aspergillus wentii]OJJ37719.1 hypothetical protein ASPWEDRAFT_108292 [Aspergillus wentii DTO 134E9]